LVGDVARQRRFRDAFRCGEAEFANKLLSAMRHDFRGHIEKPAG
jgi:6-phosphogluconate dehydrogenase (decarboxylating)